MGTVPTWWLLIGACVAAVAIFIAANTVTGEKRLRRRPRKLYGSEGVDFRRSLGLLLGPSILSGNDVRMLLNGDATFGAMLDAIRNAKVSVTLESFIFRDDIGAQFCTAMADAAQRGVRVHVLLDYLGAKQMQPDLLDAARRAGARIEVYHKFGCVHWRRFNNRTHRKLLIVDGRIGFTGGLGIGTEWTGNGQDPKHWRDTHYQVRGPVVAQMQAVFVDNWIKASGEVLHGESYFPALAACGDMDAQMFSSSPEGGSESMHLMVLLAITAANKSIDIENSYFVPDALTIDALTAAKRRGVRVRIIVPNRHTDAAFGRWAAHALYDSLLEAKIEISEYQPTMIHCKLMIVDDGWVSVGSCNFDDRSFRLNDEANLNVFDTGFAQEQLQQFETDLAQSMRISAPRWARRSIVRRLLERIAITFRSQL